MKHLILTSFFCLAACAPIDADADLEASPATEALTATRRPVRYALRHFGTNIQYNGRSVVLEFADAKPLEVYWPQIEAGKDVVVSTQRDGIYEYAPIPPGDTFNYAECDSCRPIQRTVAFRRAFLRYTLAGVMSPEIDMGARKEVTIHVPESARGHLEYWFRFEDDHGSSHWDSYGGGNYSVDIVPPPTAKVRFDATGAPVIDGQIARGESFLVDYPIARLSGFHTATGTPAARLYDFNVMAAFGPNSSYFRSVLTDANDGGPVDVPRLEEPVPLRNARALAPALVYVPTDAETVSIWANATGFDPAAGDAARWITFWDLPAGFTDRASSRGVAITPAEGYVLPLREEPAVQTRVDFRVGAGYTRWGERICVVGASPELGNWTVRDANCLSPSEYPTWTGTITLPKRARFELKLVRVDERGRIAWETGMNRIYTTPATDRALWDGHFRN